jgi:hypothetical protein
MMRPFLLDRAEAVFLLIGFALMAGMIAVAL